MIGRVSNSGQQPGFGLRMNVVPMSEEENLLLETGIQRLKRQYPKQMDRITEEKLNLSGSQQFDITLLATTPEEGDFVREETGVLKSLLSCITLESMKKIHAAAEKLGLKDKNKYYSPEAAIEKLEDTFNTH